MKAPSRITPLRGRRRQHLRLLNRRFQELALGEEMARVNLSLKPAERLAYMTSMRDYARRKGVPARPGYSVAWMLDLEQDLVREDPALSPPPAAPSSRPARVDRGPEGGGPHRGGHEGMMLPGA